MRWIFLWFLLYAASLIGYNASYAFTRDVLIYHSQVRPAAWIAVRTLPDRSVWHNQTSLITTGIAIEIRRGCDGVEAWLLLITAFLVFPVSLSRRMRAILYGTALIFTLNLVRIVSMLHIVIARPEWFELAHGLVWQSIMVLSAAVFVLAQLDSTPSSGSDASLSSPPEGTA